MSVELEYDSVGFRLTDPQCVIVEQVRPSGTTEGGLYIIDQEGKFASDCSMLYRVIGKASGSSLTLGAVYVGKIYCEERMHHEGVEYLITHQDNLLAEIEGYDDDSR